MLFPMPQPVRPINRAAGAHQLLTGLVAYYSMQESSGTRVDATGRGNDLLLSVGTLGSRTGLIGNTNDFTGSQRLSCAHNADVNMAGSSFGVSFWVFAKGTAGGGRTFYCGKGDLSGGTAWCAYYALQSSGAEIYVNNGGTQITMSMAFGGTQGWQHVIFGWDAGNVYGFLNSVARSNQALVTGAQALAGAAFTVGSEGSSLNRNLGTSPGPQANTGNSVEELGVWKRKLNQSDANALYNGGAGLAYSNF